MRRQGYHITVQDIMRGGWVDGRAAIQLAFVTESIYVHMSDGRANTPIHRDLTTLVAMEYVDGFTAFKIGQAANAPDSEDKYESIYNSLQSDPDRINKEVHVLGRGTREEKIESTVRHYRDDKRDRESDKIRDAGIHLLHPVQDANYHLPENTFGAGMGHGLFPEADLAVGKKSFDQFYQVVKDTRTAMELMKSQNVIGAHDRPAIKAFRH